MNNPYSANKLSFHSTKNTIQGMPLHLNPGNLVHNNMPDIIQSTINTNYFISINSHQRDHNKFANPFNFTTKFNEILPIYDTNKHIYEEEIYECSILKSGDSSVVLGNTVDINNISRFELNSVILPNNTDFKATGDNDSITAKEEQSIKKDKYLILNIQELDDYNRISSIDYVRNRGIILENNDPLGDNYSKWIPMSICGGITNYLETGLKNFNKLTFQILRSNGELLYPTLNDTKFNIHNEYNKLINEKSDKTNRLKSLRDIYNKCHTEIHITLTSISTTLNKTHF